MRDQLSNPVNYITHSNIVLVPLVSSSVLHLHTVSTSFCAVATIQTAQLNWFKALDNFCILSSDESSFSLQSTFSSSFCWSE